METKHVLSLEESFAKIQDPRVDRTKLHKLIDIIIIAVCAVICGAESWPDVEQFGKDKREWLEILLELPNGIPSHDMFNRVFARINPQEFEQGFFDWVSGLTGTVSGVIAIDGKTLRRSHDKAAGKKPLQRVACLGSRQSIGPRASGHRKEIERNYRYSRIIEDIGFDRLHRDHRCDGIAKEDCQTDC